MEEGDETEQSCWAHLSDVCLRRVFHWLDDRDRSAAASVCKRWNQAMYSGSLWRRRTIRFYSQPTRAETQAFQCALWYLKKFSKCLEHLEIELPSPYNASFIQRFQVTLKDLFSHLGKCNHRLVSLSIEYLEIDHYYIWEKKVRAKFIKNLATFLKRMSKQLDYLSLKGARVTLEEGCELLNSLSCLTNKSFISKINIEDFFRVHLPVYSSTLFLQTMSKFHSLVILTYSYNYISNELLDILQEHSAHSLSTMNIRCCICDPPEQVVWGLSWANLSKRAPKLNVNFIFDGVISHNDLARILLAEIPVRSISLHSCILSPPDWTMKPTLTSLLPAYWHVLQVRETIGASYCSITKLSKVIL